MVADRKLRVELTAKDKTKRAFGSVQKSLGKLKSSLFNIKTLIGAAFAGLAVRALKNFVTKTLDTADALAKTSRAIGLTTDALQELRFAAGLAGVSQEKLDAGLLRFTKTLGEARAGTGTLITLLKNNNQELLNAILNARNVDDAFNIATDALRNVGREADRAALATALFGRSGSLIAANLIPNLKATRQEARDLGLVMDKELLFGAENANDALFRLGEQIRVGLSREVLKNTDVILDMADGFAKLIPRIAHATKRILIFFGVLDEMPHIRLKQIDEELKFVTESLAEIEGQTNLIAKGIMEAKFAATQLVMGEMETLFGSMSPSEYLNKRQKELEELKQVIKDEIKLSQLRVKNLQAVGDVAINFPPVIRGTTWITDVKEPVEKTNELLTKFKNRFEALPPVITEVEKKTNDYNKSVEDLASSLDDTLSNSLADAVTNFESFRDVAKAALRDVLRALIQFVNAQAGLGSGGGFFTGLIQQGIQALFPPNFCIIIFFH